MAKKNIYLIAGHGEDDTAYFMEGLKESGLAHPKVAYIGTANHNNPMAISRTSQALLHFGAEKVSLVPVPEDEAEAEKILRDCDVVFITGGEVEDGMIGLSENIRRLLWELYEDGKVFIGISAGTIMMGLAWPHWDDEDHDFDNAQLFSCLGFVPTIFDTHCEDEGWPELIKAVSLCEDGFVGYGIPAGGMVIASPDGQLTSTKPLDGYRNSNGKAMPVE